MKVNYRHIYEQHYGSIPRDADGRSYEIHHIDGNHENNDLSNLIAVSIQEHYDVHYAQDDWGACFMIAKKMKLSPEMISEMSKKVQAERLANKTHNFQGKRGSELARRIALKRVEKGINPFAGEQGSKQSKRVQAERIVKGTHNFIGEQGSKQSKRVQAERITKGIFHFQGERGSEHSKRLAAKRIANKTHNFQGNMMNDQLIAEGRHPSQVERKCPWPECGKVGKGSAMLRWHFDNCIHAPIIGPSELSISQSAPIPIVI